jgi:hypothetical protein
MTRDIPASVRGQLESITQVYSDEGYSSETLDRPQMSQLIAAIEMGDVRRLVVYAARRYRHLPMPWRVLSHSRESFLASCLTYWKPSSSEKETR